MSYIIKYCVSRLCYYVFVKCVISFFFCIDPGLHHCMTRVNVGPPVIPWGVNVYPPVRPGGVNVYPPVRPGGVNVLVFVSF